MEIEKQVCDLEQAKRLKELGVKQESLFWHVFFNNVPRNMKGYWQLRYGEQRGSFERYSAFTVAEMGVMLPNELSEDVPDWFLEKWGQMAGDSVKQFLDVRFIADVIIMHLENKIITAEEVNKNL